MTLFAITANDNSLTDSAEFLNNVTVTPYTGETEHRCKHCGAELTEYPGRQFTADDNGAWTEECRENLDENTRHFLPHVPQYVPLSWCDSAEIDVDEGRDMITVSLMVNGSPIALSIHRADEEGHENHGKLVVLVPYAEMSTELPLRALQRGSFVVNFR
jgi:hypothetical protein